MKMMKNKSRIKDIISTYIEEEQELILNLICNIKDELELVRDYYFNVERLVANSEDCTITVWVKRFNRPYINGIRVYNNTTKETILDKFYGLYEFEKSYNIAQYLFKKYYKN